jgi:hypothetical protein
MKEMLPQDCCVILLEYHVTAVAQCLAQIRHNINITAFQITEAKP